MKHYIAYHNAERMGGKLADHEPLKVLTNKSVDRLVGNRVWFIESVDGKYELASVFDVVEVGESDRPDFKHYAKGNSGHVFNPQIPLKDEDWFPEFMKTMGHFGLGVPETADPRVIEALTAYAKSAGFDLD